MWALEALSKFSDSRFLPAKAGSHTFGGLRLLFSAQRIGVAADSRRIDSGSTK